MKAELEVGSEKDYNNECNCDECEISRPNITSYNLKIDKDNLKQLISELTEALNDYDDGYRTMATIHLSDGMVLYLKKDY